MDRLLPLPAQFDANEWFILLNIVIGSAWVWFVPRRYPRVISILLILFAVSVAIIFDHAVATPPLNMYDINDYKTYELFDVITYFMYAPYALLFVYLYDKFSPKGLYFVAYIVGWAAMSTGFQWLALKFHVFVHIQWNLFASFAVYLVAATAQLRLFRFLLKYFNETSPTSVEDR